MGQVATVKTPLTYGQALGALLAAGAPAAGLTMIAAQSAVETAGWQAMHNWNFGNITPLASQVAAGIDWMNQGLNMKYISYPDAVSGAAGMMGWLRNHGLLDAASRGDLDSFMASLRAGCYLGCVGLVDGTGHTVSDTDYSNYRSGIASWMSRLQSIVPASPPASAIASNPTNVVAIGVGIAAAGGLAAFAIHEGLTLSDLRGILRR